MHAGRWEIFDADAGERLELFREIATEYVSSLPFELDFEDFEAEMRSLPGEYAPPGGCILLAEWHSNPAGCVAVRPFGADACELKRLYVRPEFRGHGLGKALTRRAMTEAQRAGHRKMRLDTVESLAEALRMYVSMGFVEIPAYRHNPRPDARYFEIALGGS